jgi:hypothetical protein
MRNNHHHNKNTEETLLLDLLAKSLKTVTGGKININMEGQSAIKIDIDKEKEKINIDFIHPTIIETESRDESRPGLFDKLKTAKEFAQKLSDNELTLSFLRKGKEAIVLGKEAHPTFSRLITRSDDIQIDSIRESAKLSREL